MHQALRLTSNEFLLHHRKENLRRNKQDLLFSVMTFHDSDIDMKNIRFVNLRAQKRMD